MTPEEQLLLRQALFADAACHYEMRDYSYALSVYRGLAARYHHQVEGLMAWRNVWHCLDAQLRRTQDSQIAQQLRIDAQEALESLRRDLVQTPETAFDNTAEVRSRKGWEKWLAAPGAPTRQGPD